ncbi:MAG: hypothetical protein JOZ22_09195, partial [Acidobacteriia bacterium]|nr:hypothetical protein [Terriglobia bacterium]
YMDFIPRVLRRVPWVNRLRLWVERRHSQRPDKSVRYGDAFWRPPLHPHAAFDLEAGQIREALGLAPLVSLTDHDDLEACADLHTLGIGVPYSLEWSIPYGATMFHIGVHNLPAAQARELAAGMARATANPTPALVGEMFAELHALRNVLVVLNHPYSNEERVDLETHKQCLVEFLGLYRQRLHAIELNGLQPAADNRMAIQLAADLEMPAISGGDRHCREPNANLNLTNAASFDEFVEEIRVGRQSTVLFMPQYRDPIPARYAEFAWHLVQNYPEFMGRERFVDRVFFKREPDGVVVPLSSIWPDGGPRLVRCCLAGLEFVANPNVRGTWRRAMGESEIGA